MWAKEVVVRAEEVEEEVRAVVAYRAAGIRATVLGARIRKLIGGAEVVGEENKLDCVEYKVMKHLLISCRLHSLALLEALDFLLFLVN